MSVREKFLMGCCLAAFAVRAEVSADLWISNHTDFPHRRIVLELAGKTNFTYDAKGATLLVRDPAIALHLKDCRNVTIRNLTIDWARPVLTEARITGFAQGETRVRIDRDRYPVAVKDGRLFATGPGRREPIRAVRFLDGRTFAPVKLTTDTPFQNTRVREEPDGTLAILADYSKEGVGVQVGDVVVMRPPGRPYPAIFVEDSADILLEDVIVRDAFGMGLIAQKSDGITWRGTGRADDRTAGVIARPGAHVTAHADASHFSNCRGQVTVENCWFEGMMDDAINVHSTCVQITNVLSRSSVRCVFRHHEAIGFTLFRAGDHARLIRSRTNEDGPVLAVRAVRRLADDVFELDFTSDMPADFGVGDTLENADYQCAATFRGNVVRNNRARGVLFTTPGKVVCSSNRFENCTGSAVVLASDAAYWFESGHCRDVEIAGNVISNCLTAGYGYHGSAYGIVSIDPVVRDLAAQKDYCHSNIRIFGNTIFTHDVTLLFARSATGLVWSNNVVNINGDLPSWNRPAFVLERCGTFATDVRTEQRKALACGMASADANWLQVEIDAMASSGGGAVRVGPGEREFKPVVLKSGVTLRLEKGAVLLASTNVADYVARDGSPVLIGAFDAHDVAVEGEGVIDGRGWAFKEKEGLAGESQPVATPVLMRFSRCRNVRLEDFTFRQAAAWGIHLRNSDGVVARRIKAFSHINNSNDGIDVESRNVLIEDCDLDTDDDALVFKSESDPDFPVENVVVRNCRLASCCNFIKFGTGSYGVWRNIRVENCKLRRAGASWRFDWRKRIPGVTARISGLSAIALEVVDGGTMEDVVVRDVSWTGGVQTPIFVRLDRRHAPRSGRKTFFRNVRVENVKGTADGRIACSMTGVPGLPLSGVTLRNVELVFPGGGTAKEAAAPVPESIGQYPDCYMFGHGALPAWGFYLRHCDAGVRLENVRLSLAPGASDARPAIVRDDADGVALVADAVPQVVPVEGTPPDCAANGEGWDNLNPERKERDPAQPYWEAPLAKGAEAFAVEMLGGAEGDVKFAGGKMIVRKANERGWIVIRAKDRFAVKEGTTLRSFADAEVPSADPFHSVAVPRVLGNRNSLYASWGLDAVSVIMLGGPKMGYLSCTAPGCTERRFASMKATAEFGTNIAPALVVAGAPSTSIWHRWGVEDHDRAAGAWKSHVGRHHGVKGRFSEGIPADEYIKRLARDIDHTAKVVRGKDETRLVVDGAVDAPVFYKPNHGLGVGSWGPYHKWYRTTGSFLADQGIRLQTAILDGARCWEPQGFDAGLRKSIDCVVEQMRRAPDALFILSFDLGVPAEYTARRPEEVARNPDGTAVYGDFGKCRTWEKGKPPEGCWPWPSFCSPVWRKDMKTFLSAAVAELRKMGLDKRVVGFHVCGYHDRQFSPYVPDFSGHAVRSFREWMAARGTPLAADWTPPTLSDDEVFFDASPAGRIKRDFQQFQHLVPFRAQEDFARHLKAAFGKEVVALHWCMDVLGGSRNGAYYLSAFMKSDVMDGLVAQPSYVQRLPSLALGENIPSASFARNGKLFVDEFDLRTYGLISGDLKEPAAYSVGHARDFAEWLSIHHRLAGVCMARRQGWWYYEISGGFYEPPEIAADIGAVARIRRDQARRREHSAWTPSAAFVIDEKGLLSRNLMCSCVRSLDARRLTNNQSMQLAASGVPYDVWLADDVFADPSLLASRRVVLVAGFDELTPARVSFVRRLLADGRTVVLLAGAGAVGGAERLGFKPVFRKAPVDHEVESLTGRGEDFRSVFYADWLRWSLGVNVGSVVERWRQPCFSFDPMPGFSPLARYVKDGAIAAMEGKIGGGRLVVLGESDGLTPAFFNRLTREAGGYVPVTGGLQVDMNGDFVSVHALETKLFNFRLPFPCEVVNLKTGRKVSVLGDVLTLDMVAGETRWYALRASSRAKEDKQ